MMRSISENVDVKIGLYLSIASVEISLFCVLFTFFSHLSAQFIS